MTRPTKRRRYLLSYDIHEDSVRNKVFRVCQDHGDRIQFSVFVCELDKSELLAVRELLRNLINNRTDQVMVVDLGSAAHPVEQKLETLGRTFAPPCRSFIV